MVEFNSTADIPEFLQTLRYFLLQRETRSAILPEYPHQIRHDFRERFVQRPRRVDDEHAAAVHAVAIG